MDICYLFQTFPELSQTFVFDQMRYLKHQGHYVRAISRSMLKSGGYVFEKDFYNEIFIPKNHYMSLLIKSFLFCNKRKRRNFDFLKSVVQNYKKRLEFPDILVAHFGPNVLIASLLKQLFLKYANLNIPVVGVFHGYDLSKYIKKNGLNEYKHNEKYIDCFIVISKFWKDLLINNGISPNKVVLCRIGVKLPKIEKTNSFSKDIKNIVSVGRLVDKKGFDDLIIAFAKLSPTNPNLRLKIVGDGPNRKHLLSLTKTFGLADKIEFSGSLAHAEVLKIISSADLFVLASKTARNGDMEGIPVVLMEAMASYVPVISTSHSGIPELINDKVTGLIASENSPNQLANIISFAIAQTELLGKMTYNARSLIEKKYNLEIQNQLFETELYHRVLKYQTN